MPVSDPEAIRFINEQIRPAAEKIRAIHHELQALLADWWGGLNTLIPSGGGDIEDGREAEGISRLTADDVTNVMTLLANLSTITTAPNAMDAAHKACVRPFRAEE